MRLQLGAALAIGLLWASVARADDRVSFRTDVYTDQWIIVVSPSSQASVDLGDRVTLEGGFAIDVLSGVTPVFSTDAITAATEFDERRTDAHVTATATPTPTWSIDLGYAVSTEPDHGAHSGTASTSVELFKRMSTLSVAYTFLREDVGRADDPSYQQLTLGHLTDVAWAQILARRTLLSVLASAHYTSCAQLLGCQANPYRFVPLLDLGSDAIAALSPERHPERRFRGAASLRLAQGLGHNLALHAGYRFYADTWKILGHTADVGLAKGFFGERLVGRLEGRVTFQGAAAFFRDNYRTDGASPRAPDLLTGDRELAKMVNVSPALRLESALPPLGAIQLRIRARLAHVYYRYLNYRELPVRNAWLVGVGLTAEL